MPHVHNPVERTIEFTKEVYSLKGLVKVNFYTDKKIYIKSRIIKKRRYIAPRIWWSWF